MVANMRIDIRWGGDNVARGDAVGQCKSREQEMIQRSVRRVTRIVALSFLALAALTGVTGRTVAQNLEPISVIVFPGGFNWPIWVAQAKGYFAAGGIEVKLTPTPSSVFQL